MLLCYNFTSVLLNKFTGENILGKLVRDKIPQIIKDDGKRIKIYNLDDIYHSRAYNCYDWIHYAKESRKD